jgi:sugar O-acyltransferase (sialic acid O-acetyltransferase NeuD family)
VSGLFRAREAQQRALIDGRNIQGQFVVKELLILGAAGTARDVISIIDDINRGSERYRCAGLLDDNRDLWGTDVLGVPVIGSLEELSRLRAPALVNTLGSPRNYAVRQIVGEKLRAAGHELESIVHPSAVISRHATIGAGTIIFPQVVVMANARLGEQVLLLCNTVINHETVVGDYSIAASGVNISGAVRIGRSCYLGVGSSIMQGVAIGDGALVGMGSVVIRDVSPGAVLAGNPARVLR